MSFKALVVWVDDAGGVWSKPDSSRQDVAYIGAIPLDTTMFPLEWVPEETYNYLAGRKQPPEPDLTPGEITLVPPREIDARLVAEMINSGYSAKELIELREKGIL